MEEPRSGPLTVAAVDGLSRRRALVTGGAGFIGSSLVRVLLASGADVVAFDNLATGSPDNLTGLQESPGRLTFVHGDVRDWEKLRRTLSGVEIVFHLACLGVRHSLHSPHENHDVNASGTLTLLSQAREANISRFVHVSSSEVYGTARTVPMTEDHVTDPHTVYGASKLAGECYARAYHRCFGLDTVVVRPFNSYGPRSHSEGDSGEVIPRFLTQALSGQPLTVFGDGTQTRDFTHVYDTARAIAEAGVVDGIGGETINVGSGQEIQIRRLAEMVLEITGSDAPIEHLDGRPGDVLRLFADSTKAEQLFSFKPEVPLRQGLEDLRDRLSSLDQEDLRARSRAMAVRNWE